MTVFIRMITLKEKNLSLMEIIVYSATDLKF